MQAIIRRLDRRKRVASFIAAASIAALVAAGAQVARAGSDQMTGNFSFAGKLLVGCPIGSLVCSSGTFTGALSGPFQFSILAILPSPTLGVEFFNGKLTLHAQSGDINCDLNGALNGLSTSEGEFGEICVVTGGTGAYAKATGDLRLIGTSVSQLLIPSGAGSYVASIRTP